MPCWFEPTISYITLERKSSAKIGRAHTDLRRGVFFDAAIDDLFELVEQQVVVVDRHRRTPLLQADEHGHAQYRELVGLLLTDDRLEHIGQCSLSACID